MTLTPLSPAAPAVSPAMGARLDGPVGAAAVLRSFDGLRRRVALDLAGEEGLSVGLSELTIDADQLAAVGECQAVLVTAMVLGSRPGAHEVKYVASRPADEATDGRSVFLAHARGWTLTPGGG